MSVTLRLLNVGGQPIALKSRLLLSTPGKPGELTFKMLGPDKRERPFGAWISGEPRNRTWLLLQPGQMLTRTWDLRGSHDLDQEGFYALQLVYENTQDAPAELARPAWQGRLASEVVRFRRVAGEEER